MSTAALIIAILSLAMSAFALGWQVLLYLLTSARVRVSGGWAYPIGMGSYDRLYAITAVNSGRQAVTIQGFGIAAPGDMQLIEPSGAPWNPQLPHRLEPGDEVGWHMDANGVARTCREHNVDMRRLKPFVRLPGSKRATGKPFKHGN